VASKGRFLFPAYIPNELNPKLNYNVEFSFTLHASHNTAIGSYTMGYSIPYELIETLLQEGKIDYLIIGYSAKSRDIVLSSNDKIKEVEVGDKNAVFRYKETYNSYYDITRKNIQLRFVGPRRSSFGNYVGVFRKAEHWYYLGFSYICNDPEIEKEVIEYLENELIRLAEAMLEQGLPRRF